jgi:hypothetical protein
MLVLLTSTLIGGEWPASRPGHFIPEERALDTQCISGWVSPGTDLDYVEKIPDLTGTRTATPLSSSTCSLCALCRLTDTLYDQHAYLSVFLA